jgi:hypothetical protein
MEARMAADRSPHHESDTQQSDGMMIIFGVLALIIVTCAGVFFIGEWRERHPQTATAPGLIVQAWAR